jgi:hypothetical protein
VDAGYYTGDGSFFVDGGAYADATTNPDSGGGLADAEGDGVASGCAALAGCCPSLSGASQSLCNAVVSAGDATNCAAELAQLESEGECTGVAILASEIQVPANRLVSDGNLLFWTTTGTPSLLAMPVGGGPITVLLDEPISNSFGVINGASAFFLAVDDANVYVLKDNGLLRIPKNGSPAALVNEVGGSVIDVTILGTTATWVESTGGLYSAQLAVKSAPLQGGAVSALGNLSAMVNYPVSIGVTSQTVFLSGPGPGSSLLSFAIGTGVPPSGPSSAASSCMFLSSDTAGVYCVPRDNGSLLAIASNGTTSVLGSTVSASNVVFDDTYVYWADETTVGTISKAPKAGGGSAVVLARDPSPTAIAVDARSVYWSDTAGYIKSINK